MPESTFSGNYDVPIPGTRLLASRDFGMLPAFDAVVRDYVTRRRTSIGVVTHMAAIRAAQEAAMAQFEGLASVPAPSSDASEASSSDAETDWSPE